MKFKENMVLLALECLARGVPVTLDTATDVLRLAWGMSEGDVSLRTPSKLRKFKRSERRFLLGLLEGATHLETDFARRPELSKRLVHALHPGDWPQKFPRVVAAADRLYKDTLPPTGADRVEARDRRCHRARRSEGAAGRARPTRAHDALRHSVAAPDGMPALYTDRDVAIPAGAAWVFKPENEANRFEPFSLAALLGD